MSILFQPVTIGNLKLKNRFVRSATHDWLGTADGSISDKEVALYRNLAENNIGMIITGHAYVQHPLGRASVNQNAIYDDKFISGYRRLANTVHASGAALVMQISHAGRQVAPDFQAGLTPVSPSAVVDANTGILPRELTDNEITDLIYAFAAAMARSKSAGCDGVQLHVAHGYLLSQFISPHTNRRTDIWGGSVENRSRILREIITHGRRMVGKEYPILVKLNSTDGISGENYLSPEDVLFLATTLKTCGVTAIEISGGIKEAPVITSKPGIIRPEDEAYFAKAAQAIKQAANIPVILVGGMRSLEVMEEIVAGGTADLVALCRPLVMEPDLITRLKNGQAKAACISCNGCFNQAGLSCRCRQPTT